MSIPHVEAIARAIAMSRSRYLYGLDRVPDDRLEWRPESGRTPLELAARTGGLLQAVAHLLEHRTFPSGPGGGQPAPASREAARAWVAEGFDRLEAQVRRLTEADLQQPVPTPWGAQVPIVEVLPWVTAMVGYAQGQLNYAQVAYGDEDPNIPPGWGCE